MRLSPISLAITRLGRPANPDAAIKALFAAGEQGVWYDPSDLSTMFQDATGTTPVTADGQPVGKILDKSGRGNHASQATSAKRPLYKTDGTYHWLQADGVDDSLQVSSLDLSSTAIISIFNGTTESTGGVLFEAGPNWGTTAKAFAQSHSSILTNDIGVVNAPQSGSSGTCATPVLAKPATSVMSATINIAGTNQAEDFPVFKRNALNVTRSYSGNFATSNTAFGNLPLNIFSRNQAQYFFTGKLYSLIIRGANSSSQEITDTETWVNGKTGAF